VDFRAFLKQAKNTLFWEKNKVVCFKGRGGDYPCLFFTQLFDFLEQKGILPAPRKNLFIDSTEKKNIFESLQQSFLGQRTFYWLSEYQFGKIEKGNKKELFDLLTHYNGENFVSFYLHVEKLTAQCKNNLKNMLVINIDEFVDKVLLNEILQLFDKKFDANKREFIKQIFKISQTLLWDKALLLVYYLELVNVRYLNEYQDYLFSLLVDLKPSLHLLAQHFFTKKPEQFFNIWSKVYQDYSEMFWISFWTSKIFRAYYFIQFAKQKDFAKARSVSFGLPSMFVKGDWQNFSLKQLSNYHTFLYTNDFKVKTGSTFYSLDLFYLNHFCNKKFAGKEGLW
jgi:hypothetical protein